ncbi:MAG: NAD(P)-binding domain-containing protein [Duncaniella sp.]|nr:NAD(P)-binding domain-containing protein [Duncaniella sp.]MDE6065346.1 NAD(P)-binding domain-containing protein [Duncaniella sp.]
MKIAIIGAGAMGGAVARGLAEAGHDLTGGNANICVSNPSEGKLRALAERGISVTHSNVDAVKGADTVIICVKPWFVEGVINELKPHLDYSRTEVSLVVAGISLDTLSGWLAKDDGSLPQFCITMPNTAMAVLKSMTFQVNGNGECESARAIFGRLGDIKVITERQLPAAMALASCGIAYAMRYVRAATEGGVELGLRATEAQEIIVSTLIGASELLREPDAHPESEIDKVTTPGGITIRGLNAMEEAGFSAAVIKGLRASK